ncbi:MAG: DUF4191 domain-containing protein [Marmoricola sp.]
MAKEPKPKKAKKPSRIKQMWEMYTMTREADPKIGLILLAWFLGVGAVVALIGILLPGASLVLPIVTGVLAGLLAALIIFGRRGQRAALSQVEGRPGGAAAALSLLKRGWNLKPAIAFNKQQDLVHRLIGPPGIVLIGEGNPNRLKALMLAERRKHERVVEGIPMHEVVVGDGAGQVSIYKLTAHMQKMRREVKPAAITDIINRLKAIDATRSPLPIPKGPMPTSMKGARSSMRGR